MSTARCWLWRLLITGLVFTCLDLPLNAQSSNNLTLTLITSKRTYRRNEQLKFKVSLLNSGSNDIYVLGELGWGYRASFVPHFLDAKGKEIDPRIFPDDTTYSSPDDASAFVRLRPSHFLGTDFYTPLPLLNMDRPGMYSIFVEYLPRFSTDEVKPQPFWGKENGALKSNVVHIRVIGRGQ